MTKFFVALTFLLADLATAGSWDPPRYTVVETCLLGLSAGGGSVHTFDCVNGVTYGVSKSRWARPMFPVLQPDGTLLKCSCKERKQDD